MEEVQNMKHVYRIYVDAWSPYTGYFSSLDEAFRILPSCLGFRRAVCYRRPPNCEILPETFTFVKDCGTIDIRGDALITTRQYEEIPEIKIAGIPYQPATQRLVSTSTTARDTSFGFLEVEEIELDVEDAE